jgi:hypothetical protein
MCEFDDGDILDRLALFIGNKSVKKLVETGDCRAFFSLERHAPQLGAPGTRSFADYSQVAVEVLGHFHDWLHERAWEHCEGILGRDLTKREVRLLELEATRVVTMSSALAFTLPELSLISSLLAYERIESDAQERD